MTKYSYGSDPDVKQNLISIGNNKVLITDGSGNVVDDPAVDSTEHSYLDNAVSNIQDQIDSKEGIGVIYNDYNEEITLLNNGNSFRTSKHQFFNLPNAVPGKRYTFIKGKFEKLASETVIDSISSIDSIQTGVAWDGANLLSTGSNNDKIYKHKRFSTDILDSFSSPSTIPSALAWDGTNVLSADRSSDKIYKHDGFSSTILDSFSSPSTQPDGIEWDGENVISSDVNGKIYKHDGFSSTITDSFTVPFSTLTDIALTDRYLYAVGTTDDKIFVFDGFQPDLFDSFSSPSNQPRNITWDGNNLIIAETQAVNKIYKMDSKNTASDLIETRSVTSPGTLPFGAAWDGTNLAHSDFFGDKVYVHSGFTTSITNSFTAPGGLPLGISWDNGDLIFGTNGTNKFYKTNTSGTILDSFSSPAADLLYNHWDGNNLYSYDNTTTKIYKHRGFSDVIIDSLTVTNLSNSFGVMNGNIIRQGSDGVITINKGFSNIPFEKFREDNFSALTYDNGYLLIANSTLIQKRSIVSGNQTLNVQDSFSSPSSALRDLAWDTNNLLSTDTITDKIYQHSGFSSTISDSFSSPSTNPTGVAWDGANVLSADGDSAKIYRHSTFGSTITDSFSSPSSLPSALAWDGTNLISADDTTNKIYLHSGFTSTITDSFSSPGGQPQGITWLDSNLYSSDRITGKVYQHSGFSSTVTDSFSSITSPTGLADNGSNRIMVSQVTPSDKIFNISNSPSFLVNAESSNIGIGAKTGNYIVDSNDQGIIENLELDENSALLKLLAVDNQNWIIIGSNGTWETT